jgi:hypothetical protein
MAARLSMVCSASICSRHCFFYHLAAIVEKRMNVDKDVPGSFDFLRGIADILQAGSNALHGAHRPYARG